MINKIVVSAAFCYVKYYYYYYIDVYESCNN